VEGLVLTKGQFEFGGHGFILFFGLYRVAQYSRRTFPDNGRDSLTPPEEK
jgi:hypothetical protein